MAEKIPSPSFDWMLEGVTIRFPRRPASACHARHGTSIASVCTDPLNCDCFPNVCSYAAYTALKEFKIPFSELRRLNW